MIFALCLFAPKVLAHLPNFEPGTSFGHIGHGLLGSLGAFASVFSRLKDINTEGFYSKRYVCLQAFIRIMLGFLFGQLSYLLINGNIILGFLANSKNSLLIAALIAGFNERMIPEALRVADK
jgi:hypothetical protein